MNTQSPQRPHLVVLSGAGMSAESGLSTFRDSDGLWAGHDVQEVASIEGWYRDPQCVLDFYNQRRREFVGAEPNEGHRLLARLEDYYRVTIVTQNGDDLHERAGSSRVIHLHGELMKNRSVRDPFTTYPAEGATRELHVGDERAAEVLQEDIYDDEDLYPSPLRIARDELRYPSCTDPTREPG